MVHSLSHELNSHIEGVGDGAKRADVLWRANVGDLEEFQVAWLLTCVQLVGQAPEDFAGEGRAFHFFGVLAKRTPEEPEDAMLVVDKVLQELADWATRMVEPLPRARAMQLVKELLHGADGRLHEDTYETVLELVTGALTDKVVKIRKLAVQALSKVAQSMEYGPRVCEAYIQRLNMESNQAVRVATAQSMPQRQEATDTMMARTHDVCPEVRAAVYTWFGAASDLSTEQRVFLLTCGLADRMPAAQEAATAMAMAWMQRHFGGDSLRLLQAIDVQRNQGLGLQLLEALTRAKALDCVQQLREGALGSMGSAAESAEAGSTSFQPVAPELAFAWTFLARHLHRTANEKSLAAAKTSGAAAAAHAAAANDSNNLLEAFLPDSADQLACLVHAHLRAGEQHKFAVCQMLGIAGLAMEWTDGTSRGVATRLVTDLIAADFREDKADEHSEPAEIPDASCTSSTSEGAWQQAVMNFAGAVLPNGSVLLGAVLPTLRGFAESKGAAGDTGSSSIQCLAYASQLLKCLPKVPLGEECGSLTTSAYDQLQQEEQLDLQHRPASLQWLLQHLLLPCARHACAHARRLAVHCVGLFPLLPMGKATLVCAVGTSTHALNDASAVVREEAARVLLNLLLVFGTASVNDKACKSGVKAMDEGVSDLAGQLDRAAICSQNASEEDVGPGPQDQAQQHEAPSFDCLQMLHTALASAKKQRLHDQQQRGSRKRSAGVQPEPQEGLICAIVEGMARLALFQELHEVMQARLLPQQQQQQERGQQQQEIGSQQQEASSSQPQGMAIPAAGGMAITDGEAQMILDQLLRLFKDPQFEDITHIQQFLGTFFEAYCKRAPGDKRRLAQALPCTFKRAQGISLKGKKTAAPSLVKLATGLLMMPLSQQQPDADQGTEQLCQDALLDLHNMPDKLTTADKEFYRELAAMVCHLPFNAALHRDQLQCCIVLLHRCLTKGHLPTADCTLLKHLCTAKARFEALASESLGPHAPRLSEEEVEALLEHSQQALQLRAAAQRQRQQLAGEGGGPEADSQDWQSEGESEGESEASQRPAPAQKARAPKRAPAARGRKATAAASDSGRKSDSDASDSDKDDSAVASSRDQTSSQPTAARRPVRGAAAKAKLQISSQQAEISRAEDDLCA